MGISQSTKAALATALCNPSAHRELVSLLDFLSDRKAEHDKPPAPEPAPEQAPGPAPETPSEPATAAEGEASPPAGDPGVQPEAPSEPSPATG
jgi:hypothetical protein